MGKREPLTRERILDAAVAVVQRHGPAKAAVVDVARLLGVNHAMIYRHFASKEALFAAIAERWLADLDRALRAIADAHGAADARLHEWLQTLSAFKRGRMLDDPEMFAVYHSIAQSAGEVIEAHLRHMRDMVAKILRDGHAAGVFRVGEAEAAAQIVLEATLRFHHPSLLMRDPHAAQPAELTRTIDLLIAGLKAGVI